MALKKISLTMADRRIISNLIADPGDADLTIARQVTEVRRRLEIKKANKIVDGANERFQEFSMFPLSWDDLGDPGDKLSEIDEKLEEEEEEKERERLEKLKKQLGRVAEENEYTIDDAYLKWLRQLCLDKDWTKGKRQERDGSLTDIDILVHPSLLVAFADFADKLEAVLAAEEETK